MGHVHSFSVAMSSDRMVNIHVYPRTGGWLMVRMGSIQPISGSNSDSGLLRHHYQVAVALAMTSSGVPRSPGSSWSPEFYS